MVDQLQNSLRRFPPEIREQIFTESLVRLTDETNSCPLSPALLSAVRPDATLYEEALEVFYKINEFILNHNSVSQFEGLKPHAIQRIRRLNITICLKYNTWDLEKFDAHTGWPSKPKLATSLEALFVEVVDHNPVYFLVRDRALQHFSKLKVMSLTISGSARVVHPSMTELLEEKIGNAARKLDRYGVDGRLRESNSWFGTWIWEAEEGQTIFANQS